MNTKAIRFRVEGIVELMTDQGVSLEEFAKAAGVTWGLACAWSRGSKLAFTPVAALVRICNAFNVDIGYFFCESEPVTAGQTDSVKGSPAA